MDKTQWLGRYGTERHSRWQKAGVVRMTNSYQHPLTKPRPSIDRLATFAEFVRIHWDYENLQDAFRDYGEAETPLHPDMMQVLQDEIGFRRVMAD